MEEIGEELKDRELSNFLARVDEIGSLVRDLRSSDGSGGAEDALRRADEYLARGQGRDRVTSDRTVINTTPKGGELSADEHSCSESEKEQLELLKTLEEDAKERGERRKEREAQGKEHKKRGNESFRAGQFETAVKEFSVALEHTPWDISLYTNRALANNRLEHYDDAIVDCDAAIKEVECYREASKRQFPNKETL